MELHFLEEVVNSPLFGILISLIAFQIGDLLYKKTQLSVLNPLPVAIILVILFLFYFRIDFETYNLGGEYISFFLGPATVVLAVPLYRKIGLLKTNSLPIFAGIITGCIAVIVSILVLSNLLGLEEIISKSLIPKSSNCSCWSGNLKADWWITINNNGRDHDYRNCRSYPWPVYLPLFRDKR